MRVAMATVNFSVPDKVKEAFDAAYSGQNKSAVIAALMVRAVEEQALRARRAALFRQLTKRRGSRPRVTSTKLSNVRSSGRP
jgi:hypothetical protein